MALLIKINSNLLKVKGQSILEFTVFIVMVALVFLALFMRTNLQGVIQGSWRKNVASIGEEQYRGGSNPSVETIPYTADMTESSVEILQGDAYFDYW